MNHIVYIRFPAGCNINVIFMQHIHNTLVIPLQRNQFYNPQIMNELTEIYKRIEYLRNNGVKMKEIADRVDMAPSVAESGNPLVKLLGKEMKDSVQDVFNYSGLYLSYSLSSSTDSLKIEPYLISASENSEYVKVGMINAYKSVHWGGGISRDAERAVSLSGLQSQPDSPANCVGEAVGQYGCQ